MLLSAARFGRIGFLVAGLLAVPTVALATAGAPGLAPDLAGVGPEPACEGAVPLLPPEGWIQGGPDPLELVGCTGLRPGARLSNGCTMNFVFAEGNRLYVGTAGHCTSGLNQRMSAPGIGAFGTVVYRLNAGVGSDFALIRVDADKESLVDPTMCVWGGPQGANASASPGTPLLHHGHGFATGWNPVTRTRAQMLVSQGTNSAAWTGFGSGGDSGSPLLTAGGEAYAILTHGAVASASPLLYGTHIQRALSLAHGAGFAVQVVDGNAMAPPPGLAGATDA